MSKKKSFTILDTNDLHSAFIGMGPARAALPPVLPPRRGSRAVAFPGAPMPLRRLVHDRRDASSACGDAEHRRLTSARRQPVFFPMHPPPAGATLRGLNARVKITAGVQSAR